MEGRTPPTTGVALEINATWLEFVNYRAGTSLHRKPPANPSIFRVPPDVRCDNRCAYDPKLLSIGPYHRGKSEDLKAMEELKWRLLHHYLSKVPNGSQNEGLKEMKNLEKRARECYSEVINLNSNQFVEMLLLDGCFLVQIFITHDGEDLQEGELKSLLENNLWFETRVVPDLLLLENQLPYFIVEHLLKTLEMPGWNNSRLQRVAISWFSTLLPQYSNVPDVELPGEQGFQDVDHLLHLFHKWILSIQKLEETSTLFHKWISSTKLILELPCSTLPLIINSSGNCLSKVLLWCSNSWRLERPPPTVPTVPTTVELAEAGVKIKLKKANSFLHISFCKDKGVLEIPAIEISDDANLFFSNLTALEQCCRRHGMDITHYTSFLDDIINTPRDVELLHQKGIIYRCLGSDKDIASLFNKLGHGLTFDPEANYLKDVYKDLNAYCQSTWPKWRAKAVRDYFSNPWTIISLGAAVLLLGLTLLQTVYTVLGYYKT